MHKNTIAFVLVAALAGFIAGFWLANSINRSALSTPTSQNATPISANATTGPVAAESDLTDAEIKLKIADADKNPQNLTFQKDLGVSLYKYAAMKMDTALLGEATRILGRANSLSPRDFDVLVALGNANFDLGYANKDSASFQTAREVYSRALEIKPGEPDVATDFGLTYFLQAPPAYDRAAAELQKVSDANPSHQRSLQFLVQVYVKKNQLAEADKALAKLKSLNPNNSSISELDALVAAKTPNEGSSFYSVGSYRSAGVDCLSISKADRRNDGFRPAAERYKTKSEVRPK